jgi:hypothetical protein
VPAANHLVVWNQAVLFCELIDGAHRENGEVVKASETCRTWRPTGAMPSTFEPMPPCCSSGLGDLRPQIDGTWSSSAPEYDAVLEPVLQSGRRQLGRGAVIVLTTPRFACDDGPRPRSGPRTTCR